MKNLMPRTRTFVIMAATVLLAGPVRARTDDPPEHTVAMTTLTQPDDDARPASPVSPLPPVSPVPPASPAPPVVIEDVEPSGNKAQTKVVTWLGLAVEESSEALSSQLGLKRGEGLTVTLIATDSPAAKAEFHKNDVLVELDGQMLVHPLQLRKLVQMHAEGDTVKLTFYRGGKKQTVSVKLGRTSWAESSDTEDQSWHGDMKNFQFQFNGMDDQLRGLDGQLRSLDGHLSGMDESMARVGLDKARMNLEIKRTMEQTRKAIDDAVRHASSDRRSLTTVDRELETLAREGVDVDKDATVIVRNKHNSNRTMVQTDDSGSYIIEAGAKTHLTARDRQGKLLFEGEIDTPAEREKVPKEVWEKVAPMLDQIIAPNGNKPKTEGKSRGRLDGQLSCC